MPEAQHFQAGPNDDGTRVDRVVRRLLKDVPLSHIYRMIRTGRVRVNGKRIKTGYRVQEGDELTLPAREGTEARPRDDRSVEDSSGGSPLTKEVELSIVFENEHLLVVNKPAGQLTHGDGGSHDNGPSLEEQVRNYLRPRTAEGLSFRPGPLHRLDRNTSGAIAFSKSIHGARAFSAILENSTTTKAYLAVLSGTLVEPCRWDFPLSRHDEQRRSFHDPAGKPARTWVFPVQAVELSKQAGERGRTGRREAAAGHAVAAGRYTLAVVRIGTGRTHQIRAHAAAAGLPILGDPKYGGPSADRLFLHAWVLALDDPHGVLGSPRLEAPLPADFSETIRTNFGGATFPRARDIAWSYTRTDA